MAFITQALELHSPYRFSATRNSPLSSAATASKTAVLYSSESSRARSSNAASIFSLIPTLLRRLREIPTRGQCSRLHASLWEWRIRRGLEPFSNGMNLSEKEPVSLQHFGFSALFPEVLKC
jgi:hypothetical protein